MRSTHAVLAALAVLAARPLSADVVLLVNGDRVTGKVVGKITRRVRVQTPYGVLVIPAEKVERIRRDDGLEEVLNAPPAPPEPPKPPPPPPVSLTILVAGTSFWQAWDPRAAPEDPSLRLEARVDGRPVASYTDANLDPDDLPKAIVNSFVFSPERLFVSSAEGAAAAPPAIAPGEIRLSLALPPELAGPRRLVLAYQVNDGPSATPSWRDVVLAEGEVTLAPEGAAVRLRQERGTMEYARRRMRNVEAFSVTIESAPAAPAAP